MQGGSGSSCSSNDGGFAIDISDKQCRRGLPVYSPLSSCTDNFNGKADTEGLNVTSGDKRTDDDIEEVSSLGSCASAGVVKADVAGWGSCSEYGEDIKTGKNAKNPTAAVQTKGNNGFESGEGSGFDWNTRVEAFKDRLSRLENILRVREVRGVRFEPYRRA